MVLQAVALSGFAIADGFAWWVVVALVLSLLPLAVQFARQGVMSTLRVLDRRWIFLLMFWAVLMPIYYVGVTGQTLPEVPSALAQATFDEIDRLQPGDPILLSFDYDPPSEGELAPMATAFVKHAAEKRLLAEWMDLGGKYYNDPFNANAGVRTISTLSQRPFSRTLNAALDRKSVV